MSQLIVLSEARDEPGASPSAQDMADQTRAAQLQGARVFFIPKNFDACLCAESALWQLPSFDRRQLCVWLGFIPSPERYAAIYDAALAKNVRLLNDVDEHLRAMEIDRSLPLLGDLTPASVVLDESSGQDDWRRAGEVLGFPIFVRGAARSRKYAGWKACVAENPDELLALTREMFDLPYRSRGRVIVRKLVALRHSRVSEAGFRLGREYRVFLLSERVLGLGYYWEGADPLRNLSADEESVVRRLAIEAARRVGAPFVAVDVGQLDDGSWTIIEVGDAQFAATGQMAKLELWSSLVEAASTWGGRAP